jgi:asparagine synthase (glutamine-hydrolysing)
MSALGGECYFKEAQVDERMLTALGRGLDRLGPDGGRQFRAGSIGMVYRAFHTNRESRFETQPFVSPATHVLCWDGRLDNREDLIVLLRDFLHDDYTDAAIVMAAYLKWEADFLSRIIGDFALSLWDPTERKLFLARDPFGTRPLFYHAYEHRILWSSELSTLLDLAGIKLDIDDEYVAGFLTLNMDPERTPYKGILSVGPGNVVTAQNGRLHLRRFWGPDPKREFRYRSDHEYQEHFKELFREAVRCRLRVDGPVWAQLSGGLDSSSVVCIADEILKDSVAQASRLETVSYVYGDKSPDSDEVFIAQVEEKRGKAGYHLNDQECWIRFPALEDACASRPNTIGFTAERYHRIWVEMQKSGGRVLLSGFGGDHLLWPGAEVPPDLADFLVQFKFHHLHNSILSWSQSLKMPYLKLFWKGAMLPIMPRKIRARFRPDFKQLSWVDEKFVKRMGLRERLLGPTDIFSFDLPSSRKQSTMLLEAIWCISPCHYRDLVCIEMSYPFMHRPLVEFLMGIPFEQKLRPTETRSLHRRALRDVLPEKLARRVSKGGSNGVMGRSLSREWPRLKPILTNPRVCTNGYVDAKALTDHLHRARHGQAPYTHVMLRVLPIEFWLRALEQRTKLATPSGVRMTSSPVLSDPACSVA